MTPEQIQALAAMSTTPSAKESKTIDYKIAMANKKGDIKSVGILKVWKRFSDAQIAGIVEIMGSNERVTIELIKSDAGPSDDEF